MFAFRSSKNKEITFPHEFTFVFILYFIGAMLPKKFCEKLGFRKEKDKNGGNGHIGGGCL